MAMKIMKMRTTIEEMRSTILRTAKLRSAETHIYINCKKWRGADQTSSR